MSRIATYLSYLPKRPVISVLGVLMAVALTATAFAAFGPDRPTKVYSPGVQGFDHVTFNSFTNVPNIGDERQFYNGQYEGETSFHPTLTQVREGDVLTMNVYVHNGADESLNANGSGIARDVNVKVDLPQEIAKSAESTATISASNAQPQSVWSSVNFAAENGGNFALDYVEGSATIENENGVRPLSDSLVSGGVNIGDINGCFKYVTVIEYKVKVNSPNYSIQKQVAVPGEEWQEDVTRDVGDETSWLITFENKGSVNLDDVTILDDVPPHNTVVPGSVQLFDTNFPNGHTFPDSAIQNNGKQINLNIGTYAPGGVAYIKFKTTIDNNIPDLECNTYRFQNVAYATPKGYSPVNDSAWVYVEGPCDQPFIRCEVLTSIIDKATRTVEATVEVEKSEDVTVTGYEFDWGDGTVDESDSNVAQHSYEAKGSYNIVATVQHEGGETTSVTCQAKVNFDKKPPVTPDVPGQPGQPSQPGQLPVTGPGEVLASLFGTGSLAGATHMWVNSRRALKAKSVV